MHNINNHGWVTFLNWLQIKLIKLLYNDVTKIHCKFPKKICPLAFICLELINEIKKKIKNLGVIFLIYVDFLYLVHCSSI